MDTTRASGVRDGRHGIELRGLTKTYGQIRAVRGIDLTIASGEIVALLGPNGAGKSTTIDMVLGLTKPDAGTVRVFGDSPADAIRRGAVGAMLQTGSLIPEVKVRELLAVTASLFPNPLPVDHIIDQTGIGSFVDQFTNKLSGGQRQRARFALAIASNPDLMILDEPTVAMDVESRRSFWTSLRALASTGKTVVFATHYLEEADDYADRIVLMAHGDIVADGPANEIKATVGSRTIRATLPDSDLHQTADLHALAALPGVTAADRRGEAVVLTCSDSDQAIRALLSNYPTARDIEITAGGLEEAFLELTTAETAEAAETSESAQTQSQNLEAVR